MAMNFSADNSSISLDVEGGNRPELSWRQLGFTPYPYLAGQPVTRCLLRLVLLLGRSRFLAVEGLEHLLSARDPFILAANHSTALEALLLPALLTHLRRGKRVHFLADWNYLLIPPVALFFVCGEVIPVVAKPARPRFLNRLRPLLTPATPSMERAQAVLCSGRSIGIFPEGTRNPSPSTLMRGKLGAARLAVRNGVPILPVGMRRIAAIRGRPVRPFDPFVVRFGPPLVADITPSGKQSCAVEAFHARIMRSIARLSGSQWVHDSGEEK